MSPVKMEYRQLTAPDDGKRIRWHPGCDDRQPALQRDGHLRREDLLLDVAGREVVVIVEANLADRAGRKGRRMRAGDLARCRRATGKVAGAVRMDARCEADVIPLCLDEAGARRLLLVAGGENAERGRHSRRARTRDGGVQIAYERLVRQVQ